MINQEHF